MTFPFFFFFPWKNQWGSGFLFIYFIPFFFSPCYSPFVFYDGCGDSPMRFYSVAVSALFFFLIRLVVSVSFTHIY